MAQVFDQLDVWVVAHYDLTGTADGADKTGKAGAGTKFEDGFVLDQGASVVFEVVGDRASSVPQEMTLHADVTCGCLEMKLNVTVLPFFDAITGG